MNSLIRDIGLSMIERNIEPHAHGGDSCPPELCGHDPLF